ncbi:monocarboxylate transporter 10-like isoform X1 [Montipora capricornis]|uniref:monocarboxylate transporter 10-like isoform X1 n=1 Tax=Montipora capricornis TaxID=246305 RepID=UPI0035F1E734
MAISQLLCSAGPPRKRDSLWSWLVCACATMTWIPSFGLLYSFGVFLPVFMDYFKASRETAAAIGSVAMALKFFTGLFTTFLVTWLGCRVTALIGGAVCAIGLVASSFVKNISLLFLTYSVFVGLGCSCTYSAGLIVLKRYFSKRQSIAVGIISGGIGFGVIVMSPTAELMIRATDWQTTFLIMAGVIFLVSLLTISFDPNVDEDQETTTSKEKPEVEHANQERKHDGITSKIESVFHVSIWKEPPVIALFLPVFCLMSGHFIVMVHLIRYCEELGISSERATRLFVYRAVCTTTGRLLAGFLCNHPKVDAFNVFQATEFAAGLTAIFMTVNPSYTSLIVCIMIYGLGDGSFFTCMSCLALTVSPPKTAAVLGWMTMMSSLFVVSGPPLAGLLADKLGSYVVPFRVAGGITVVGAFIPFTLLCYKRTSQPTDLSQREDENQKLLK